MYIMVMKMSNGKAWTTEEFQEVQKQRIPSFDVKFGFYNYADL